MNEVKLVARPQWRVLPFFIVTRHSVPVRHFSWDTHREPDLRKWWQFNASFRVQLGTISVRLGWLGLAYCVSKPKKEEQK